MFHQDSKFNDFNQQYRVLCLAPPEFVQSLEWNLQRLDPAKSQCIELVSASWSMIHQYKNFDLVLCQFDLGQAVPITHIEKIQEQGLALFVQPTPKQLLEIAALRNWVAVEWDGASMDQVAVKTLSLLDELSLQSDKSDIVETLEQWAWHKKNQVKELLWLNAPEKIRSKKFIIPEKQYFFSIGAAGSQADFKLPVEGRDEFLYFQYIGNTWALKPASEKVNWSFSADPSDIKVGDLLKVFNFDFELRADGTTRELINITQGKGLSAEELKQEGAEDFSALLKTLLLRQYSGELRIKGKTSYGYVYVDDGRIIQAYCGSVIGIKALLRIQEWEESSWIFQPGKKDNSDFTRLYLTWPQYRGLYERWKEVWSRVQHLKPPLNMRLSIHPDSFHKTENWSEAEYRVTSAVAEYSQVRSVLNFCPLYDYEIVEVLVNLRKRQLLSPVRT